MGTSSVSAAGRKRAWHLQLRIRSDDGADSSRATAPPHQPRHWGVWGQSFTALPGRVSPSRFSGACGPVTRDSRAFVCDLRYTKAIDPAKAVILSATRFLPCFGALLFALQQSRI